MRRQTTYSLPTYLFALVSSERIAYLRHLSILVLGYGAESPAPVETLAKIIRGSKAPAISKRKKTRDGR